MGLLWLAATLLIAAALVALFTSPRWFWLIASSTTSSTRRVATSGSRRREGACPSTACTLTGSPTPACFAPGSLLDPAIHWEQLDAHNVLATYTNGAHSISGVLVFEDSGKLVNFWSDDRPALAEDGKTLNAQRWSTPVRDYRDFGSTGSSRTARPAMHRPGEYAYAELELLDVTVNPIAMTGH
jgi:hypothetical protein